MCLFAQCVLMLFHHYYKSKRTIGLYHYQKQKRTFLIYYGPVLISGYAVDSLAIINMAHTWIIDEELTRRRRVRYNYQSTDYTEVYQEDRVIHMNIGAYGYANGYYYPDYLNIGMGPINFRNDSLILNTNLDIEMNTFLEYYYDIY